MNYNLTILFILFVFYSFGGWLVETLYCYYETKKLVNRGFLIGPICPIYGSGCLLIILLLNKYVDDPIALFVMAIVICSILEYFTSYIMEKLFKARWWDYSDKKYHINGRICLDNIFAFGILALLMMYVLNPFILKMLALVKMKILNIAAIIIFLIFLVDFCVSLNIISSFKKTASSIKKDDTMEITKKVRSILMKRGGLYKRLVSAFNFKASENLIINLKRKVKTKAKQAKEKISLETKNLKKRKIKER